MDHRIAKDMISSGMIPSGEKKKEDLGRSQYGSAPSPSALADVYKKMYEVDEAIDPMDFGKSKRTEQEKVDAREFRKKLGKKRNEPMQVTSDRYNKTNIKPKDSTDSTPKPTPKPSKGFGESSVDLLAAYNAVYEHHKKDADGNTIPHDEDIKVVEGIETGKPFGAGSAVPAGETPKVGKVTTYKKDPKTGKLNKSKPQRDKKGEDKQKDFARGSYSLYGERDSGYGETRYEGVDLYDILREKFLEEGYDEKTVNYIMVELADDIKTLSEEPISLTIGALLAKGAAIAAKGAAVGAKVAGAAAKGGMAAAKGIGTATKGIASAAKPVASAATKSMTKVGTNISKGVSKAGTKIADTTKNVSQQVKNVATQTKDKVGQKIQDIAKDPQALKDKVKNFAQDKTKEKVKDEITKDRPLQKINKTGVAHAGQTDIAASTDLFDIVKGRLLDEGLSEEEIKDIMLTLTPDEILSEVTAEFVLDASKRASAKSTMLGSQGDKQGMMDKAAQAKRLYDKSAEKRRAGNYKQGATPQGPSRIPTGEA